MRAVRTFLLLSLIELHIGVIDIQVQPVSLFLGANNFLNLWREGLELASEAEILFCHLSLYLTCE